MIVSKGTKILKQLENIVLYIAMIRWIDLGFIGQSVLKIRNREIIDFKLLVSELDINCIKSDLAIQAGYSQSRLDVSKLELDLD